jgi:hypothetical protein
MIGTFVIELSTIARIFESCRLSRPERTMHGKFREMLVLAPADTGVLNEYVRFGVMCIGGPMGIPWFDFNTNNPIGQAMSKPRTETITLL